VNWWKTRRISPKKSAFHSRSEQIISRAQVRIVTTWANLPRHMNAVLLISFPIRYWLRNFSILELLITENLRSVQIILHCLYAYLFTYVYSYYMSTRLLAGGPGFGVDSPPVQEMFLFSTALRPVLRPIWAPIQWVPETLSPGVKWPCEADHSCQPSDKFKNVWSYISSPPYVFIALCII
jgi:hypothetical protein